MHTNQTANCLILDNVAAFTFPDEIRPYLDKLDWSKIEWTAIGLPAFQSVFTLTGNQLYFEATPDGEVKIERSLFHGTIVIHTILVPDNGDKVFFVAFELTFSKGVLTETRIERCLAESREAYDAGFKNFLQEGEAEEKRESAWWFNYLYKPYFFVVSWTAIVFVACLELFVKLFLYLVDIILPIKPKSS